MNERLTAEDEGSQTPATSRDEPEKVSADDGVDPKLDIERHLEMRKHENMKLIQDTLDLLHVQILDSIWDTFYCDLLVEPHGTDIILVQHALARLSPLVQISEITPTQQFFDGASFKHTIRIVFPERPGVFLLMRANGLPRLPAIRGDQFVRPMSDEEFHRRFKSY